MGGCVSTTDLAGKARSDEIDKQIEEDNRRLQRECTILLLGPPKSGKTTIMKQMKIIQKNGFSEAELAEYRQVIYKNVLDSAQVVVLYMRKTGIECVEHSNRALAEKILDYRLDMESGSGPYFSPQIAEAIHHLWKDPIIPKIMEEHPSNFYLMDSAAYFFEEVLRIGLPDYLPNDTDILRARQKPVGIMETRINMGQLSIRIFDLSGQRSERKKWIHCFENVNSIIFCTALSEYDQVLSEDKTRTQMTESLVIFESVINSRWFRRTPIILFLNKIDLFKDKLPRAALEQYFPDYTDGPDVYKAAKYVLRKFMQVNKARLSMYPHLTQATDTTNMRLVFEAVKETVLQNALKDSGIL